MSSSLTIRTADPVIDAHRQEPTRVDRTSEKCKDLWKTIGLVAAHLLCFTLAAGVAVGVGFMGHSMVSSTKDTVMLAIAMGIITFTICEIVRNKWTCSASKLD